MSTGLLLLTLAVIAAGFAGTGPKLGGDHPQARPDPGLRPLSTITGVAPPPGAIGSLQLTLSNLLATATGAFQEPVFIDSSAHSDLINSNWTNGLAYYTANGTPVHAWIESNATNTATSTLLWLRVASIPSDGSTNISIDFGPKSSFDLSASGYMGESPELSARYGQFDNGATVFNFYDGFEAAALSGQWSGGAGWNYTAGVGFSLNYTPGHGDAIVSTRSFAYPAIVDFYGDLFEAGGASTYIAEGLGSSICIACSNESVAGWVTPGTSGGTNSVVATGTLGTAGQSAGSSQHWGVFTSEPLSTSQAVFELNYSNPQTLTTNIPSGPLPVGLAISGEPTGTLSSVQSTDWIRERTYLAEFPSVQVHEQYTLSFVGSGLASGTPWNVTFDGLLESTTGTSVDFESPIGSFAYLVGQPAGVIVRPGEGVLTVRGPGTTLAITFVYTQNVTFTESGLSTGTVWSVAVNGSLQSSSRNTIAFPEPAGTYPYVVGAILNFVVTPADGSVVVVSSGVAVSLRFSGPNSTNPHNTSGPSNSTGTPQFLGLSETEGLGVMFASAIAALVVGLLIGMRIRRPSAPPPTSRPAARPPPKPNPPSDPGDDSS